MKTTQRRGAAAFTLIELMAVITIIVILAGLVVGGLGYVQDKQANSKAKIQMALLSKAIQDYQSDMGKYPPSEDSTDGLGQSDELFKALYWDSDDDGEGAAVGTGAGDEDQKIYLGELNPATNKQGWTSGTASARTKIVDPWNNEYRYRSAFGRASANGTAAANASTENPDFDLWSAGKDGKSLPTTTSNKVNLDDIKNP